MAAFPTIHELEAINLLVTMRRLVTTNSAGIMVLVNIDNATSAATLSSGRAVYPTLGACAIEIRHKPGAQLQFADALSRAQAFPSALDFVRKVCASRSMDRIRVTHPVSPFSSL